MLQRHLDKLFNHRLIYTPLASYAGLGAVGIGAYGLIFLGVSPLWLLATLVFTFVILMGVTVGMHRLFCHMSFRTNHFWEYLLAYVGTLAMYGSTVQWCAMHTSHHRYADTEKDPHYTGWRYLFWKKNRKTEFNKKVLVRLYRQPLHRFLHRYYTLVIALTCLFLFIISPWALVFCYLIPLFWLHFVGSFHQVFAHGSKGPRNLPIMEALMFTGGEWLHRQHHDSPKSIRFGSLDAGFFFIRLISV